MSSSSIRTHMGIAFVVFVRPNKFWRYGVIKESNPPEIYFTNYDSGLEQFINGDGFNRDFVVDLKHSGGNTEVMRWFMCEYGASDIILYLITNYKRLGVGEEELLYLTKFIL